MDLEEIVYGLKLSRCKICNGPLQYEGDEVYYCSSCKKEFITNYGIVKRYLEQNGLSSIEEIVSATGVKKELIKFYLEEGKLEIPENSIYFLVCQRCGAKIKTGRYCEECTKELAEEVKKKMEEDKKQKEEKHKQAKNEKMHYLGQKRLEKKK